MFRETKDGGGLYEAMGCVGRKERPGFLSHPLRKRPPRFAAVQARQLGYGSVRYIAEVVGCSRRTIERGRVELDALPHDPAAGQVRRPGAGRKKKSYLIRPLHRT